MTGLLVTAGLVGAGGLWAGCSNGGGGTDGGGNDSGGNDVSQGMDTGGNDTGTNDSGGMDSGGFDSSVLDCNYYCTNIMATCNSATNKQYLDMSTCMAMCASIPVGTAGQTSGDTLGCRMYHVGAAMMGMPDLHCSHAGPYGFGGCGNLCEDFCARDFSDAGPCVGDNYPTHDVCLTYCNGAAGGDASTGDPGNTASTPSMQCREYHLENAYKGMPTLHCPHAGEDGGGACP